MEFKLNYIKIIYTNRYRWSFGSWVPWMIPHRCRYWRTRGFDHLPAIAGCCDRTMIDTCRPLSMAAYRPTWSRSSSRPIGGIFGHIWVLCKMYLYNCSIGKRWQGQKRVRRVVFRSHMTSCLFTLFGTWQPRHCHLSHTTTHLRHHCHLRHHSHYLTCSDDFKRHAHEAI
jgi:hypothetical protein